jgi:hypothetical protein
MRVSRALNLGGQTPIHLCRLELREQLKERLGDQRGGSECEPIKILLLRENSTYTQIHNQGFLHEFAKVT